MNAAPAAAATAVVFIWLGMVLAISFLETPLKFRAPGVDIPIGLGIGRIVFRALNRVEITLALVTLVAVLVGRPTSVVATLTAAILILLTGQLIAIRPQLNRRSDRVLAGENPPRSTVHLYYVALEAAKVVALAALGICLLVAG
ncbi:hypothetical protein EV644_12368 [Kribbella orskensis]|uniref:Transmembrane protein n=1 Tax=Kribbella orskensis TaxID=2512216 RepID=A0ABY2BAG1_9ACTN|nr:MULTISPECIES: hypothetical protein [Kribbella]TCN32890.1 hypothetical protein EV642_12555 [Kribbella sp. VKM Ac-2500]TCO13236.1 hypothetical protein EV644_12368 [Kribbella orskensis]